jgi:small subunit ribosomal protein S24e
MEIQIIKDKTNPLLKRREISVSVKNKTTASRIELKNKLAALLNSKPELIVIEHLGTIYGKQEMMAKANLYETEERMKQISHQHLRARDAPKIVEGQEQAAVATPVVATAVEPTPQA